MGKRANTQASQAAAKSTKKPKVLASVVDAILEAEHLPERCRAMLVDMIPLSLGLPNDTRHELQAMAVSMVERTLNGKKAALEDAVVGQNDKLSKLLFSKDTLEKTVKGAEVALASQSSLVDGAKASLGEATEAARARLKLVDELTAAKECADAKVAAMIKEKQALESVFEAHYKVPMESGTSGPHFSELEPFLKKIQVEPCLINALPSTCAKSKGERGSFDLLCLQELERAITSKIASLGESVVAETPAALEREVKAATQANIDAEAARSVAQEKLSTEESKIANLEVALTTVISEFEDAGREVDEAMVSVKKAKDELVEFQDGPLAEFGAYERRTVAAEVAPAGA